MGLRERLMKELAPKDVPSKEGSVKRGKALRASVPRSAHAVWEPEPDRPDPVELLRSQGKTRVRALLPLRYERMSVSAFTFYRGAALISTDGRVVIMINEEDHLRIQAFAPGLGTPLGSGGRYDNMLGRVFEGGAELSMGQWQRVAIARMLHTDAPVMVLDEPMAWMDMPTRELFLKTVEQVRRDKIIIMITHA